MALWLQKKYINLISSRLQRFKWKSSNLANCRCPFCGDSKKKSYKARGYIYEKSGNLFFICHNCGKSISFQNFLKEIDPVVYKEFLYEKFKDEGSKTSVEEHKPKKKQPEIKRINLPSIDQLSTVHFARKYLDERKIPKKFYDQLYFAEDYKKFIDELVPNNGKDLQPNDPRLVIPFRDAFGNVTLVQGRTLANSDLRYIAIKVTENAGKIFGLDRFEKTKKTYVCEGPIDSLFLDNCLATGDSNLLNALHFVEKENTTFIIDNQNRNKEVVKTASDIIDQNCNIFIWPEYVKEKDINELITSGYTASEIHSIINNNTFSGLEAKFRLNQWKKI